MLSGKVRCVVMRIPQPQRRPAAARQQDALPWADPYILGLIDKLQREVRQEREAQSQLPGAQLQWEDSYFEFEEEWVEEWLDEEEAITAALADGASPPWSTDASWLISGEDDEFVPSPSVCEEVLRHPR